MGFTKTKLITSLKKRNKTQDITLEYATPTLLKCGEGRERTGRSLCRSRMNCAPGEPQSEEDEVGFFRFLNTEELVGSQFAIYSSSANTRSGGGGPGAAAHGAGG